MGPLDVSLQHLVSATQPKLLLTVLIIESSECNVINVTLHRQSTDGRSMVDRLSIDTWLTVDPRRSTVDRWLIDSWLLSAKVHLIHVIFVNDSFIYVSAETMENSASTMSRQLTKRWDHKGWSARQGKCNNRHITKIASALSAVPLVSSCNLEQEPWWKAQRKAFKAAWLLDTE